MQIGEITRIRLGTFPTPLQELRNLGAELGGPRLFIKRDDMTGLGLGGNKLRKLEYAMAEAQALGATAIITIGGPQSNHVRLTTAAANKLGLPTILVLRGEEPETVSGNLLIDRILGAREIHFVGSSGYPSKAEVDRIADEKVAEIAARLTAQGETPYIIPNGCRALHGALGYSGCVFEIIGQLHDQGLAPSTIVTAIGTSSTYTGLALGSHLFARGEIEALGVSVAVSTEDLVNRIDGQLQEATGFLKLDRPVPRAAVRVVDEYVGPGYGLPTQAMKDAVLRVAQSEGIVLDPVYTGKAMSGLIDRIERGKYGDDDVVVFLHTGGIPGLFADNQLGTFAEDC